jgi:cell division septation protein DedD
MSDQADKNSADTDDTMQAPSSEEPGTAIVAPDTTNVDRNELAWSLDETDEIRPTRHGRIVSLGLVALLAGIVAAVTLLAATFFGHSSSKPVKPSAVSTTATVPTTAIKSPVAAPPAQPPPAWQSTSTEMPPPPPGVTTQPPNPAVEAAKREDAFFLQLLAKRGWPLTPPTEPLIWEGRNVCALMEGPSHLTFLQVTRQMAAQHSTTVDTADMFVDAAVTSYCPHQLGY